MNNDLKKILRDLRKGKETPVGIQLNLGDDGAMRIKGEAGYTPQKGIDYWTREEINEIVETIFKAAKPNYGVDYYTDTDKRKFVAEVLKLATPVKGVHYRDGVDGRDGIDGKDGVSPDSRAVAIDAINFLESFEGDARLSAKALKDLDEAVTDILKNNGEFEFSEKQIKSIKDLLPQYPPMNAGGSGATFLKSLRDVDLSGLTKNADGKYVLGGASVGGGHTIKDEGTPLTQRTNLNFVGATVTVTDDAGNDATVVTITGGGAVDSVNSQTGVVVLDADDIDDTSTIQKFATAAQLAKVDNISITQAVDLDAIEAASHAAVTVADSAEIDFTLTGQQISASIVAGSIDETKLDASVNASLDLADTSVQLSGIQTVAGVKTFSSDPIIPDEVYGAGWNGSLEPATKNALYDKIETLGGAGGVAGTLNVNTTAVGNITTGEDDLITYSVSGNTLSTNNDYLTFEGAGIFATSINNKRVRVKLGATTIFDSGALAITTASDWRIHGTIVRTGSAAFKAAVEFSSSSSVLTASADYQTGTDDLTTALTLKFTGEATATDDVVQNYMITRVNSTTTDALTAYQLARVVTVTSGSATVGSSARTDYVYFINGAHTMSLAAASGNTNRYTFKNNHSAAVTIDTVGIETIDGAASIEIAPEDSVDIISNGTNYNVV